METDFRIIRKIKSDPPTFVQDHLTWQLLPFLEEGIPYRVTRNDGQDPTEDDMSQVNESMLFLIAPQWGPTQ